MLNAVIFLFAAQTDARATQNLPVLNGFTRRSYLDS